MKDEFVASLSRRERDVVDLLLQGKSNKQIALALGVSERTVEFHLNNIYGKFDVASRLELALKLGKPTGADSGHLVKSTVETDERNVDNGNQPARTRAAHSWRNTVSLIKKEVAMTVHISFEELENYLRSHLWLFGMLMLLAASLTMHQALYVTGLYFWGSYLVLAGVVGLGSVRFGRLMQGRATFRPLVWLGAAVLLPLLAVAFDQLYLITVLRFTEPISMSLIDLATKAEWVTSPGGTLHRSTHLSSTSDTVWWITIGYMVLLFAVGRVLRKRSGDGMLAV